MSSGRIGYIKIEDGRIPVRLRSVAKRVSAMQGFVALRFRFFASRRLKVALGRLVMLRKVLAWQAVDFVKGDCSEPGE